MNNGKKIKIFLVDDDIVYLKALEIEFMQHADFDVETYVTGEYCIENLFKKPDVIILDYHLDGVDKNAMNGLDTLVQIKLYNREVPVIILSSQDKMEVAVNCMRYQAKDYVVKSETAFFHLHKTIINIFSFNKIENTLNWYVSQL